MDRICAALLFVFGISGVVHSEGLIYHLPPDGHWASYTIKDTSTDSEGKEEAVTGKLTLSSVGTENINGKTCRWIEIAVLFETEDDTIYQIDRLLIPEESLQKGQEPLTEIYKLHRQYGQDRKIMKIENPKQLQQFAERANSPLRMFLHGPYETSRPLARKTIESKLGKQECEGIQAKETTEHRSISVDAEYTIRLHSEAPFGVVQWKAVRKIERDGRPDGTINHNLTLSAFGTGAKTALPDEAFIE